MEEAELEAVWDAAQKKYHTCIREKCTTDEFLKEQQKERKTFDDMLKRKKQGKSFTKYVDHWVNITPSSKPQPVFKRSSKFKLLLTKKRNCTKRKCAKLEPSNVLEQKLKAQKNKK